MRLKTRNIKNHFKAGLTLKILILIKKMRVKVQLTFLEDAFVFDYVVVALIVVNVVVALFVVANI